MMSPRADWINWMRLFNQKSNWPRKQSSRTSKQVYFAEKSPPKEGRKKGHHSLDAWPGRWRCKSDPAPGSGARTWPANTAPSPAPTATWKSLESARKAPRNVSAPVHRSPPRPPTTTTTTINATKKAKVNSIPRPSHRRHQVKKIPSTWTTPPHRKPPLPPWTTEKTRPDRGYFSSAPADGSDADTEPPRVEYSACNRLLAGPARRSRRHRHHRPGAPWKRAWFRGVDGGDGCDKRRRNCTGTDHCHNRRGHRRRRRRDCYCGLWRRPNRSGMVGGGGGVPHCRGHNVVAYCWPRGWWRCRRVRRPGGGHPHPLEHRLHQRRSRGAGPVGRHRLMMMMMRRDSGSACMMRVTGQWQWLHGAGVDGGACTGGGSRGAPGWGSSWNGASQPRDGAVRGCWLGCWCCCVARSRSSHCRRHRWTRPGGSRVTGTAGGARWRGGVGGRPGHWD